MILKENLLENNNEIKKGKNKMIFIVAVIVIIYFIEIAWTLQSLGWIEKNKKILIIIIGNIAMAIITFAIFQIAKGGVANGVEKLPENVGHLVKNLMVAIFTGVNGIIILPQIAKILDKINEDQIEKSKVQKRVIILAIVFVICLVFETSYMKQTQASISKLYQQTISQ